MSQLCGQKHSLVFSMSGSTICTMTVVGFSRASFSVATEAFCSVAIAEPAGTAKCVGSSVRSV